MAEELEARLRNRKPLVGRNSLEEVGSLARKKPLGENRETQLVLRPILAGAARFNRLVRAGSHFEFPAQ